MIGDKMKETAIDNIAKYWRLHRGTHTFYFFKFFFCEILNFANCIGQVGRNHKYAIFGYCPTDPNLISVVLHWLLSWWRVWNLRNGSCKVQWDGARGTYWPHGSNLPQSNQVHFLQIWSFRNCGNKRWPLCIASQYHKWEDLHSDLVLARISGMYHRNLSDLPIGNRPRATDKSCSNNCQGILVPYINMPYF